MDKYQTAKRNTDLYAINSEWWRFDRYELRGGYVRPAPGAKLEVYNLWEEYFDTQRKDTPPYHSLLNLIDRMDIRLANESSLLALTPESKDLLLVWCAENGLLGMLPQQVQMVVLAAKGQHLSYTVESSQSRYIRKNNKWYLSSHSGEFHWHYTDESYFTVDKEEQEKELKEHLSKAYRSPYALIQLIGSDELSQEPLSKTWASFFPDVPENERETYEYPEPLSEEFWQIYAEPVEAFLRGAVILKDALEFLGKGEKTEGNGNISFNTALGLSMINSLVSSVGTGLYFAGNNSYRQQWASSSLLASYAAMAVFDLAGNRPPRRCEGCKEFFIRGSHKALHCSDTCRHTAQKRRYRDRKRQKGEEVKP